MVKAAVMVGPGEPIQVREFPTPALEEGAVLLHTLYSEVCGTDVHLHAGHLAGVPFPLIPGHVNVGEIAEIRGRVVDLHGEPLRVGQVVTFLDVHETCGHCWYCTVARPRRVAPSGGSTASPIRRRRASRRLGRDGVPEAGVKICPSQEVPAGLYRRGVWPPPRCTPPSAPRSPSAIRSSSGRRAGGALVRHPGAALRATEVIVVGGPEAQQQARRVGADLTLDIADERRRAPGTGPGAPTAQGGRRHQATGVPRR